MDAPSIWLLTGAQASGKSTTAELLAGQFGRGVHVRGGQFYRWAVRGWVHWNTETQPEEGRRLLDHRYRLSALVADEYAAGGFACVVQDNIYGDDVTKWLTSLRCSTRHLVVLRPSIEAVSRREAERQRTTRKTAYKDAYSPARNDADLALTPRGLGLWLGTTELTPEAVIREIIRRRDEAILP